MLYTNVVRILFNSCHISLLSEMYDLCLFKKSNHFPASSLNCWDVRVCCIVLTSFTIHRKMAALLLIHILGILGIFRSSVR